MVRADQKLRSSKPDKPISTIMFRRSSLIAPGGKIFFLMSALRKKNVSYQRMLHSIDTKRAQLIKKL